MPTDSSSTRRTYQTVLLLVVLAGLGLLIFRQRRHQAELSRQTCQLALFNTVCTVRIFTPGDHTAVLAELAERLQSLHDCLDIYQESSELSRLNATAFQQDVVCSDLLWDCLAKSREAYALTDGAFDITVGPLMKLWGFHHRRETLPTDEEIAEALARTGLRRVVFDEARHAVRFTSDGLCLDLGGIAKGYACDIAADLLLERGIDDFLLDFGGNLRLAKTPRQIGVRDPSGKGLVCTMELADSTVATSGNYERSRIIDGRRVGHIMDPATGRPGEFFLSVTAITPAGYMADALSTAVFVRGKKLAEKVIREIPGTTFIVVNADGTREEWR